MQREVKWGSRWGKLLSGSVAMRRASLTYSVLQMLPFRPIESHKDD